MFLCPLQSWTLTWAERILLHPPPPKTHKHTCVCLCVYLLSKGRLEHLSTYVCLPLRVTYMDLWRCYMYLYWMHLCVCVCYVLYMDVRTCQDMAVSYLSLSLYRACTSNRHMTACMSSLELQREWVSIMLSQREMCHSRQCHSESP